MYIEKLPHKMGNDPVKHNSERRKEVKKLD